MPHRLRFDPKRPLVAARDFTFMGVAYKVGDPFNPEGATDRLRARQYEARAVNFGEGEAAEAPDPVQMTGPKGGRYTITAPWLAEPEIVRGKVNAETRLAELQAKGAPLGFIEGGSAVTVEGGEGGWYEVSAPWLDEPEKVQGREAAEARQQELHDAGEPDSYRGVTLTAGENGWYILTREGVEGELKVHGEEAARDAAAKLRAGEMIEGQPADWDQPAADEESAGGEGTGEGDGEGEGEADATDLTDPPAVEETGGESQEEETDMANDKDDKREGTDAPNEPGTNEPNGAEVINDEKSAETGNARGDQDEGGETSGHVGP